MRCGLNPDFSLADAAPTSEGFDTENVKSSPLNVKAAKTSSQLVILAILASCTACGGRYGCISDGKEWPGKLDVYEMRGYVECF